MLFCLQVDIAWGRGDVERARQASRDALIWNIISTFTGGVMTAIGVSLTFGLRLWLQTANTTT